MTLSLLSMSKRIILPLFQVDSKNTFQVCQNDWCQSSIFYWTVILRWWVFENPSNIDDLSLTNNILLSNADMFAQHKTPPWHFLKKSNQAFVNLCPAWISTIKQTGYISIDTAISRKYCISRISKILLENIAIFWKTLVTYSLPPFQKILLFFNMLVIFLNQIVSHLPICIYLNLQQIP